MLDGFQIASGASTVAQQLRVLAGELSVAGNLTERAFLEVGERVGGGHRQCRQLLDQAQAALQPDGEGTIESVVARLQLLTEREAIWLAGARSRSESISAVLQALELELEALLNPMKGLAKVGKVLQALRVSTRIDAARNQGHGALVLGQELQLLGTSLGEKLEKIVERCEVLAALRRRAMEQEERAQMGPLLEAENEIRRTRALLSGVASRCVRTADHAGELHHSATGLSASFGELVAALQFQDITRQRLQHIERALTELSDRVMAQGDAMAPHVISNLCELQHDQLQRATVEFDEAVGRLADNLRGMMDGARTLAEGTCSLLYADNREQYAAIAPSLHTVTECLEKVQITHLAAGQAVFAVCQAVCDVDHLSGEVEQLGEEMQLLAQNAAVSAAHGADRSVGLSVIAASIQSLAEEAGGLAVAMAGCCRRISRQSEKLDELDQGVGQNEGNLDELLAEAQPLLARMEEGGGILEAGMAALGGQVERLATGLEAALAGLEVRHRFRAKVDPVLEQLRAMSGAQDQALFDDRSGAVIDGMRSRYTMKSEREVHRNFLQKFDGGAGQAEEQAVAVPVGSTLGNNVELF